MRTTEPKTFQDGAIINDFSGGRVQTGQEPANLQETAERTSSSMVGVTPYLTGLR